MKDQESGIRHRASVRIEAGRPTPDGRRRQAFGLRHVFRGAAVILGGSAVLHLTGLAYNIPVVRLLQPARVGELAVATSILDLVYVLSGLGLGTGVVRYLSRYLDAGSPASAKGVARAGVVLTLAGAGLGTLGVVAFALLGVGALYPAAQYRELRWVVVILGASVVPVCLTRLYFFVYQAAQRPAYEQVTRIAENVFRILLVPATFLLFRSLRAVAGAIVAATALTWVVGRRLVGRVLPLTAGRPGCRAEESASSDAEARSCASEDAHSSSPTRAAPGSFVGRLLAYSWPLTITTNLQMLMQRVDILCLGYFRSDEVVGLYRPAASLAMLMWIVPQALTYLLFPMANRLLERGESAALGTLQRRAYKYLVLFNLPALAVFVPLAPEALWFLYGRSFVAGAAALPLLAGAVFVKALYVPCQHVVAAYRRTKLELVLNLLGFGVNLGLNLALIPVWGLVGAALATFASMAAVAAGEALCARRISGFWSFDGRTSVVLVAASGALAALAGTAWPWGARLGGGALAVAAAWGAFLLLDGAERTALRGALADVRRRGLLEACRALLGESASSDADSRSCASEDAHSSSPE